MERRQLIDLINKYAGYAQSQLIREKLADAILAELNEYKEKEFCTCINKPDVYIESLKAQQPSDERFYSDKFEQST